MNNSKLWYKIVMQNGCITPHLDEKVIGVNVDLDLL
jgi:hypothetical protein